MDVLWREGGEKQLGDVSRYRKGRAHHHADAGEAGAVRGGTGTRRGGSVVAAVIAAGITGRLGDQRPCRGSQTAYVEQGEDQYQVGEYAKGSLFHVDHFIDFPALLSRRKTTCAVGKVKRSQANVIAELVTVPVTRSFH